LIAYHFLDDSGDPGLTGAAGSSSHFVLAMVELPQRQPLSQLSLIRQKLHLSPLYEFKYYKAPVAQKEYFFQEINSLDFKVRGVTIHKRDFAKQFGQISGSEIVIELASNLILRSPQITNQVLVTDAFNVAITRAIRIKLSRECARLNRLRPFKQIVSADSKREEGLQLADMIAGAMRHYVMGLETNYYQMIRGKIVDLWEIKHP